MNDPEPAGTYLKTYHDQSVPERDAAQRLYNSLEPWKAIVPPGPVLEIGAGTGNFTSYLSSLFTSRTLEITDKLPESVGFLKSKYKGDKKAFFTLDVEQDPVANLKYSLVCANHVAHQFKQPAQTLEKMAESLKVDGIMLASFSGEDSFPEWRASCLELGIPFTGKAMPGTEPIVIHLSMGPVQVDFYEDQSTFWFDSISRFLNHQQNGGADAEQETRKVTQKEAALLTENWVNKRDGKIGVTYHNVFLALKRITV